MSAKILLINSNQETSPSPVLPIGMAYVASSLAHNNFDVCSADLCFKKSWRKYLQRKIKHFKPDFLGISIRNIDNNDQVKTKFYLENVKNIIDFCRSETSAGIFCGGAAMAVMPVKIIQYVGADFGIFGDGEDVTPKFLSSWIQGTPDLSLPGIVYKEDGKVKSNAAKPIENLEAPFTSEIGRWLDMVPYFKHEAAYPIQAKRGCQFDCIYCTYARCEGKRYRSRCSKAIVDEILAVNKKYRPKTFEFVDSIFNHPTGFAEDICRELINAKSKANLNTIELNPKFLTTELIDLMEKAGFTSCGITCESASDKMLQSLKKSYNSKDVISAARRLKNSRMKKIWIFLLGGPGENEETVKETLDFVKNELGNNDVVYFNIGIRIYPGTDIETIALEENVIDQNTDLLYPTFYFSSLITRETIEQMITNANCNKIVTIKDLQIPGLNVLLRLINMLHLKGPYWSYAPILNKIRSFLTWQK